MSRDAEIPVNLEGERVHIQTRDSAKQKPDWSFRIAAFGMFFILFMGVLGGFAAYFGWKT